MSDESKEQVLSPDTTTVEEKKSEDVEMEDHKSGDEDSIEKVEKEKSKENSEAKDEEEEEEKKEDDDEEEEEESEDDEPHVGLLEKPLVLEEGKKRERKKVERMSFQSEERAHEAFEIKEGKGRSLGDIPYIEFKLGRTKAEDAKPLHRILFRRVGSAQEVKKNIRQFSGFPFAKSDQEYEKRVQMLKGKAFTTAMIKHIMDILDIPRSGTKDELITRLMEWLEKPKDSGRKIPQAKRKRKSKGSSGKDKGKKDKKKKEKKKKKQTKTKAVASDDEDEEEDEEEEKEEIEEEEVEEEEKEESDVSDVSEDEEEEPPKKKVKKATPKPTKEKKPKVKATPKVKAAKPSPKKKPTPKKKAKEDDVSDISSDSDDQPLVAKQKSKGPPTNDELKDVIKKMLDNANLEQVTMKTVLKDVFAKYPDFDLADRKEFIKNTVKQIIS